MVDFRELCAELADALRNAIRVVYHEDGTQHISTAMPILRKARPAQPAPPVEGLTFSDAIQLAQGCHDYSGGHSGFMAEAFHGGIDTVISALRKAAAGSWDFQTQAVFAAGAAPESAPPAEGETAELSPKEIEARDAFTAMRDEILHGLDGFDPDQTNAVLDVIDNHTPEWV